MGARCSNSNGAHCHNVAQTTDGLPAFLYLRPCPENLRADVPFDTTTLADGSHHLVVSVTNAAGNSTVALDRKVTVDNHTKGAEAPTNSPAGQGPQSTEQHAQPIQIPSKWRARPRSRGTAAQQRHERLGGGSVAGALERHREAQLAGSYGRAQSVSGRLTTPAGPPIGGAVMQVLSTPAYERAPTRALGTARTAANGAFSFRVPASTPSARLTFAYSAQRPGRPRRHRLAAAHGSGQSQLANSPAHDQQDGTIVFSGTLSGGPLPPGGKQLVLEARTLSGQWRQFQVLEHRKGVGTVRLTASAWRARSTTSSGRSHAGGRFPLRPGGFERGVGTRAVSGPLGPRREPDVVQRATRRAAAKTGMR